MPEDLVGHVSEDPFTFELTGTLPVDRTFVLRADVESEAIDAFGPMREPSHPTRRWRRTRSRSTSARQRWTGTPIVVQTSVTADAVPELDQESIRRSLVGMTAAQAQDALATIGPASVDLWPGWVDRLPRLDWRISVSVEPAEGQ